MIAHRRLKSAHFWPLAAYALPTLVVGYGFVIPASCIAGLNELTIGYAATVAGAAATYWAGIVTVLRDEEVQP
ncbi:MAG: hypothetical protein HN478_00130 [Rhodospirillaceae bacterium]|jgi:hypothetical protein|nr:hypothetical protein [Rhodospirillaceae bacterium]MBT4487770.1 hypothetical protein [Rhodospirillaceae bacterium]MBT5195027.1 hypothetical protein [Rhodospirillaceae bacterium]MBT5897927.1 hypothetical protein [Rhodospirillaceae bacterium]MBT6430070.1 hypothetical protein [Rhodospirillaceae bacterium]